MNFSMDIHGAMAVKCHNENCKYHDIDNLCLLFRIEIDEEGKCSSREETYTIK